MFDLLRKLNNNLESMEAKKLLIVLLNIFVVFLLVGVLVGYIRDSSLKKPEIAGPPVEKKEPSANKSASYEGRVTYIDPKKYESDGIKYALYDINDKEIILLKTGDQKLDLLEGMFVGVKGTVVRSKDSKKDILYVSEVIMNATN